MTPRTLRIALLLADTPVPRVFSVEGDYLAIYRKWLQRSIDAAGKSSDVKLEITGYDVVNAMTYPLPSATFDCIMITGSASSAYSDLEWIDKLVAYVENVPSDTPLIGICFGHQVIARAHRASVIKNPKGWELGTHDITLTNAGKKLFGKDKIKIQEVHQDHVPTLPDGFDLLAQTEISPVQGFVSSTTSPHRILCVQGHPEFTTSIVEGIIETRREKGILSDDFAAECVQNAKIQDDGIEIGQRFIEWLGY